MSLSWGLGGYPTPVRANPTTHFMGWNTGWVKNGEADGKVSRSVNLKRLNFNIRKMPVRSKDARKASHVNFPPEFTACA